MNRRGFLRGIVATVALTTGLARTRLELIDDPQAARARLDAYLRHVEAVMRRELTDTLYADDSFGMLLALTPPDRKWFTLELE